MEDVAFITGRYKKKMRVSRPNAGSLESDVLGPIDKKKNANCPICVSMYEPGLEVIVLGCKDTHLLHLGCYNEYKRFAEQRGETIACPVCRTQVDGDKVREININFEEIKLGNLFFQD